jgi:predicted site-specific integrase-resolvase
MNYTKQIVELIKATPDQSAVEICDSVFGSLNRLDLATTQAILGKLVADGCITSREPIPSGGVIVLYNFNYQHEGYAIPDFTAGVKTVRAKEMAAPDNLNEARDDIARARKSTAKQKANIELAIAFLSDKACVNDATLCTALGVKRQAYKSIPDAIEDGRIRYQNGVYMLNKPMPEAEPVLVHFPDNFLRMNAGVGEIAETPEAAVTDGTQVEVTLKAKLTREEFISFFSGALYAKWFTKAHITANPI